MGLAKAVDMLSFVLVVMIERGDFPICKMVLETR